MPKLSTPWLPGRKPNRPLATAMYDPRGRLSKGLRSLLLFDSISVSSTVGVAYMYDYANPTQTFIFGGTAANVTIGHAASCGGQSINETGTGTGSDFLQYQAPLATTTSWSMSALVQFDGLAHASGNLMFFADHFAAAPLQVSTVNHQFVFNGGASIFGPDVTTLNGWYRVHITSDGTTSRAYINGVANGSPSSVAAVLSVPLGMVTLDWPWPVADFFWWQNRVLTPAEIIAHYADPYGTTMKPRLPARQIGDTIALWAQPHQPQHPKQIHRSAMFADGDKGIEAIQPFFARGILWAQSPILERVAQIDKAGILADGDRGIESTKPQFIPQAWNYWPQPDHPLSLNRSGIFADGDRGIEATSILPIVTTFLIDTPASYSRTIRRQITPSEDGIEFPLVNFIATSWDSWPQPPHPKPERTGAVQRGDEGSQAVYQAFTPLGWPVQPYQPQHPRTERSGAIQRGDDGAEGVYQAFIPLGWPIQDPQPPHPKPERAGAIMPQSMVDAVYQAFVNYGWHIQAYQPMHPKPERSGAQFGHDDSIYDILRQPYPLGWQVQDFQPSHPRPERSASIDRGIDGIDAIFSPSIVALVGVWDSPFLFPRKRFVYLTPQEDGIEFPLINFSPQYWYQDPQLPHPKPERSAAVPSTFNIDAAYQQFFPHGYPVQPFQPPHPRPERAGAIMPGINIDAVLQAFFPYGWPVQPFQPPHRRVERAGGIMPGINLDAVYQAFVNYGWPIQPWQPPHRRPERAGAIMRGTNDGLEGVLPGFQPYGWEIAPPFLAHPRPERSGGVLSYFNIDPIFLAPPSPWGYEAPPPILRLRAHPIFLGDMIETLPYQVIVPWFEQQPFHPFRRHFQIPRWDDGNEAVLFVPPNVPFVWGHAQTYAHLPHPRPERSAVHFIGDQGISFIYRPRVRAQGIEVSLTVRGIAASPVRRGHP